MTEWCFIVNHAIKVENYKDLVITLRDADVFVCALYYFSRWIYSGLKKLWIVAGKSISKFAIPVHTIPVMHALTDCNTRSKVGTKASEMQVAIEEGQKLLFEHATEFQTFDELRHVPRNSN